MGDGMDEVLGGVGSESGTLAYYDTTESSCGVAPFDTAADVVVGPYRLLEVLGEGASSRVYAAEHLGHGHRVALKIMLEQHSSSLTKVMRFLLECELLERIRHPNVVALLDRSENGATERFTVLELLEGETLRDKLFREGLMSPHEAVEIGLQLASALETVHAAGVIHCDVKPDNVSIDTDRFGRPTVKLFDFDAARWIDRTTLRSTAILPAGAVLGTPGYMAPEQEQGCAIDHRADIFAFGATMYELLTGAAPYVQTTLMDKIRTCLFAAPKSLRSYPRLRNIPATFDALIRSCVERAPEKRPSNMTDIITQLREIEAVLRDIDVGRDSAQDALAA
jgi:serine/threonine protein kinase